MGAGLPLEAMGLAEAAGDEPEEDVEVAPRPSLLNITAIPPLLTRLSTALWDMISRAWVYA